LSQMLSAGMELLVDDFTRAGELCEAAVTDLVSAYTLGARVGETLMDKTQRIQRLQDEADELAAEIIVRLQPQASDLRFVKSCQKMTSEFSRLVRYAYEISDFVTRHATTETNNENVKQIGDRTRSLIEAGIRSLRTRDVALGEELKRVRPPPFMTQSETERISATSSALLLRFLDRVSNQAASIGNSVRYIATGEGS